MHTIPYGQTKELVGESFMLIHIENFGMATKYNANPLVWSITTYVFKIVVSIFLLIILMRSTLTIFKISSALILGGFIGNALDQLLLYSGNDEAYQCIDYLYVHVFAQIITNISSMLFVMGIVLLFISIVIRFNQFKKTFRWART